MPEDQDDDHAVCRSLPPLRTRPIIEAILVHRDDQPTDSPA